MTSRVPEVDVAEASRRMAAEALLVDVREPHEYSEVRIPGAKLLPMSELNERYQQELPRDRELLIQCRSGVRSAEVARLLNGAGYRAVNVTGGIIAWEGAGLPVERGE